MTAKPLPTIKILQTYNELGKFDEAHYAPAAGILSHTYQLSPDNSQQDYEIIGKDFSKGSQG